MKILRLLLTVFGLLVASQARASTPVSGPVDDEVWTAAGSPYLVTGNVSVGSLVIHPGVEVRFQGDYVFLVEGFLQVRGSTGNEVRFTTTNAAVGWQGIWFLDSVPGSFLKHAIIEHSKNSAVRITNSAPAGGAVPAFTNCTIINNASSDFGGGIDATLRSGDLILDNCDIRGNTCGIYGGGINAVLTTGTLKMVHCTVVSNIANIAAAGGSYAGGGIRISGHSLLLNCVIAGNTCYSTVNGHFQEQISYGGGIYSDTGNAIFRNCRFQGNSAQTLHCCSFSTSRSFGGAVCLYSGHLTMQNCVVDTNTCSSSSDSAGAGIFVGNGQAGSATADIINCTIVANNTQGLYGWGGAINCINSVLFFNNSSAEQIGGTVSASYSDIQGGYTGEGNKTVGPLLREGTLELRAGSPCIDGGNPDSRYDDSCIPPARGTVRNDMGAYGGPAGCCWVNPCGPPVIASEPKSLNACINSSATLCVSAIGDEPLRYQWYFYGTNAASAPAVVAGATNACLNISTVQSNNAGYYSVSVVNAFGTATSSAALLTVTPVCVELNLYAGLSLSGGVVEQVYRVQYVTNVNDTSWTTLTTVTQKTSGVFVLDPQPANQQRRFYRIVQ